MSQRVSVVWTELCTDRLKPNVRYKYYLLCKLHWREFENKKRQELGLFHILAFPSRKSTGVTLVTSTVSQHEQHQDLRRKQLIHTLLILSLVLFHLSNVFIETYCMCCWNIKLTLWWGGKKDILTSVFQQSLQVMGNSSILTPDKKNGNGKNSASQWYLVDLLLLLNSTKKRFQKVYFSLWCVSVRWLNFTRKSFALKTETLSLIVKNLPSGHQWFA